LLEPFLELIHDARNDEHKIYLNIRDSQLAVQQQCIDVSMSLTH
jgi:hypothetical protein